MVLEQLEIHIHTHTMNLDIDLYSSQKWTQSAS